MASHRPRDYVLTPQLVDKITAYVRAGGHAHVAAEAAGIPQEVFWEWMLKGDRLRRKRSKDNHLYQALWQKVLEARGQAQLRAEIKALEEDPLAWLKFGPGKETKTRTGWSGLPRPLVNESNTQVNVLLAPEMQGLFASVLQILAPHPEARAAVARALAGQAPSPAIILEGKVVPQE